MREQAGLAVGCAADDFTGAGDAASFLAESGARCLLLNGVPEKDPPEGYDAIVIAMKTRSLEPRTATERMERAFRWLADRGAEKLYFKYCSTFDSTRKGNIGPVLDSLLETRGLRCATLCPALPVNGRTVRGGRLYVNGLPLDQSPMKDHPLNPMWDSFIPNLMRPQSKYPAFVLERELLRSGSETVRKRVRERVSGEKHFYLVPDYFEPGDGKTIAELFSDIPLHSGGSAFAADLFRALRADRPPISRAPAPRAPGRGLVLAGSCSEATRRQIRHFAEHGGAAFEADPSRLMDGSLSPGEIEAFVERQKRDALVYSAQEPSKVQENREQRGERVSEVVEELMASLAKRAVAAGVRKLVVAGGETSGAVARTLGCAAYEIGLSLAPGVPVLSPLDLPGMSVVFKSGNFGGEDFFVEALAAMSAREET
jgi:uncharacterized protein YgbK (DUF1537 family)